MNFIQRRADYEVEEDFFSLSIYFSLGITLVKLMLCYLLSN